MGDRSESVGDTEPVLVSSKHQLCCAKLAIHVHVCFRLFTLSHAVVPSVVYGLCPQNQSLIAQGVVVGSRSCVCLTTDIYFLT